MAYLRKENISKIFNLWPPSESKFIMLVMKHDVDKNIILFIVLKHRPFDR